VISRRKRYRFQIFRFPDEALCHKLTAFVIVANLKFQKTGSRGDRVSAPTIVDGRTRLKGAERELRNTAVFATAGRAATKTPRVSSQPSAVSTQLELLSPLQSRKTLMEGLRPSQSSNFRVAADTLGMLTNIRAHGVMKTS
jgi:hypothetical protein